MMRTRRQFLRTAVTAGVGLGAARAWADAEAGSKLGALSMAFMCWRIGDILDFDAQVQWVKEAGFESIGFHASRGHADQWRGVDPARAGAVARQRLQEMLSSFDRREIHAPFKAELAPVTPEGVLKHLEETFAFAGDVGADIVTVHVNPPKPDATDTTDWYKTLDRLDQAAGKAGIRVGLEFMHGFDWLRKPQRKHIGATLDIGHMYLNSGAGYKPYGAIRDLIRHLDDVLFHVHIHDYNGEHDHMEIGSGHIDFDAVLHGLAEVNYGGFLCLELNPDRVTPEGIVRSGEFLRRRARELDLV